MPTQANDGRERIMVLIDVLLCPDCAIVIANGDSSGIEDAETHLARMESTLTGYASVDGPADLGFYAGSCDGCGETMATDQWFAGWVEQQ